MKSFRALLPYIRPHRRKLMLAVAGMIVFTLLSLVPPLLNRYLIDSVVVPGAWQALPLVVLLMIAVPISASAVRFLNVQVVVLAGRRLIADVRTALYSRILNLGIRYHGEHAAGALVGRIMGDVNMLQNLLTDQTVRLVIDVVIILFAGYVAFSISTTLALVMCAVIASYVLAYRFFARRIKSATHSYRRILDRIAARLQETIIGVRQVRIYNREEWENTVFLERTADSLDRMLESTMATVSLSTACQAISGLGSVVVVGLGGYMVLNDAITYGDLMAFNIYMWMLITPVVEITTAAGELTETAVSIDRIAEILTEQPEIRTVPGAPSIGKIKGEIEFRNVRFSYDPGVPLFENLCLRIQPGTSVALVGPTGCGKTTMTSLMLRHFDVLEGAILMDGIDIRSVNLRSLRSVFGVVLQAPVIFEGTLAENIAYGMPGASEESIMEAARVAEVSEFAAALPDGIRTRIGSRGVKLSLGEKQRVSIARAILRDPPVLIMDEATSSLDSHSEALIQKALANVMKGRTSFVVAHRLSTIVNADTIVVMDGGRIVQSGSHMKLMFQGGLYKRLYQEMKGRQRDPAA